MAPYLATSTVGVFDLKISRVGRIPNYVAVDPTLGPQPVLEKIPAIVRFFERDLRARTRSTRSARSSTTRPTWATRSRRRRSRCSTRRRTRRRSSTSSRTCGSATRSRSRSGRTSGCTRASRPGRSGSGASARAASPRPRSSTSLRDARDRHGVLDAAAGQPGRAGAPLRRDDLRPRRHDAPGAAREDRRLGVLRDPAPVDGAQQGRERHDAGVRGARRAHLAPRPRPVLPHLAVQAGEAGFGW